ncbi:FUSC family protein [Hanstruepera neustonica]|uniref:FUSC family protein n=1 Tax=Hanstruepera neustonica TaxID=1445657 RepID=A0A2K1DXQ9_9FLAO|nr:FUSC family protein [Hanstruepera neustonica]PNQ72808.1 FUSC family protein [Hanstruepera neustonica]
MRTLLTTLALIAAILSVILSVLPLSNLAFIPAIAALIFGLVAFYLSNKKQLPKHTIKLAFLLTILALGLATYKSIFSTSEVGNTQELEQKEQQSEEEAIEELEDLDLDDLELE